MTRIRASCPACGEVDLRPDDVALRIVRSVDGEVGHASSYRFCCPGCADTVVKPADERIVQLLATGGVSVEEVDELAELEELATDLRPQHPESPGDGPTITHDDLLDLHLAMARDGWLEALLDPSST